MRSGLLASLGCAAAIALSSSAAIARDPVAAEALFRAGREAAARGDWAGACDKLAESQRLDPAPGTLINLGDCKEHLGLFASAWASYHEAADHLQGDARLDVVKRRMNALEPRLSRLTIALAPGAPPDTTVTRDGEPLGPAAYGVPLPIDPGKHELVVAARGREAARIAVDLAVGEAKTAAVAPGPPLPPSAAEEPNPAPPADPSASGAGLRAAGFAVGGVGLLSLGAGVATGIMTMQRKSQVDTQCVNQACTAAGVQAASEGKTLSTVSTATFVAGLAGVSAGVVMVVVGSKMRGRTAISPVIAPGHAGLVIGGSF